jgi:hypothetical protein
LGFEKKSPEIFAREFFLARKFLKFIGFATGKKPDFTGCSGCNLFV